MAEYRLSPLAEVDVREIAVTTLSKWGAKQARAYLEKIHTTLMILANNPSLGRQREEIAAGIKSFPSGKHVVFYLSADQGIDVARVLHQRMDPSSQFDELR